MIKTYVLALFSAVLLTAFLAGCVQSPKENNSTEAHTTLTTPHTSERLGEPLYATAGTLRVVMEEDEISWKLVDVSSGAEIGFETLIYQGREVSSIIQSRYVTTIVSRTSDAGFGGSIYRHNFYGDFSMEYSLINAILVLDPQEQEEGIDDTPTIRGELYNEMQRLIEEMILADDITLSNTSESVLVILKSDDVFASGRATINSSVTNLALMLSTFIERQYQHGNLTQVVITVHTDDRPINNTEFPSNTSISLARAESLMDFILSENNQINPSIFVVEGMGDMHPIASNDTTEGRAKNRRIEILFIGE